MEGNGEIIETLDGSMFANLAEGETITLSLEEASQLLLDGGQFAPGTYQIVTTGTPNINQELVQVPYDIHHDNSSATNQSTMVSLLPSNIQHLTPGGDLQTKNTQDVGQEEDEVPMEGVSEDFIPDNSQGGEKMNVKSEGLEAKFENQAFELEQDAKKVEISIIQESGDSNSQSQTEISVLQSAENGNQNFENVNSSNSNENPNANDTETTQDIPNEIEQSSTPDENSKESEKSAVKEIKIKKEPKPDLDCPISVSDRTEVVINGKKCVLLVNPDTKEMCAYPLLPPDGKRRRGRPKKPPRTAEEIEIEKEEKKKAAQSQEQEGDQNSSAVQGLLELSNSDPDSLRRSGRARKKTKTLEEYENLELSDVEDIEDAGAIDDDDEDEDVVLPGYKRRKIDTTFQSLIPTPTSEKRPRGRPRRYPPAGQVATSSSIPAVLIPSSNGQTLMMAPLQGVQNLQSLQSQVKSINTQLLPSMMTTDTSLSVDSTVQSLLPADGSQSSQDLPDGPTPAIDTSSVSVIEGTMLNNLEADSLNLNTSDSALTLEGEEAEESDEKPTIIQIPENLLPMFVPKKDPVRIGKCFGGWIVAHTIRVLES
ncbi:hypothetical protein LOTGIDRAFT_162873 [Lottia gigantea]|uniref:Uncharacterized protein n=1 Tax=Lottia gigantea TaxID=225164 RepID=V3ZLJ6_LOTGI|nr:hypothetical protein LOTGIDRAFT_162873 [Lottia gigantea]ESO92218.1 hypothetical protein LOTGIDRAFT_162873 [Lottia gigantea]